MGPRPNQRTGSAAPALAGALAAAAPELLRSTSLVSASCMFSSSSRFIREKSAAILVRVRVGVRVRVRVRVRVGVRVRVS